MLGVQNVCALGEIPTSNATSSLKKPKNLTTIFRKNFAVQVLQSLPLLQLETSLKRAPTVDNTIEAIAEATVFSGQT